MPVSILSSLYGHAWNGGNIRRSRAHYGVQGLAQNTITSPQTRCTGCRRWPRVVHLSVARYMLYYVTFSISHAPAGRFSPTKPASCMVWLA